jgi:hypothetical protein
MDWGWETPCPGCRIGAEDSFGSADGKELGGAGRLKLIWSTCSFSFSGPGVTNVPGSHQMNKMNKPCTSNDASTATGQDLCSSFGDKQLVARIMRSAAPFMAGRQAEDFGAIPNEAWQCMARARFVGPPLLTISAQVMACPVCQ